MLSLQCGAMRGCCWERLCLALLPEGWDSDVVFSSGVSSWFRNEGKREAEEKGPGHAGPCPEGCAGERCCLPAWDDGGMLRAGVVLLCPPPGISTAPWRCSCCLATAVGTARDAAVLRREEGSRVEAPMGPGCHGDGAQLPRSVCYVCLKLMERRGFMETSGAGKRLGLAERETFAASRLQPRRAVLQGAWVDSQVWESEEIFQAILIYLSHWGREFNVQLFPAP